MNATTIQTHSHRLNAGPNATAQQYWEAAASFTNACCWDERVQYRMIAKTDAGACWNPQVHVVCDKLCDMQTGLMYDMVMNAGTAQQSPGFMEVTGLSVDPADHVHPYDYTVYVYPPYPAEIPIQGPPAPYPLPPPGYPPYPGDEAFRPLGDQLFADYDTANTTPDPGMSTWYGRVIYDWLTGVCPSMEASIAKHHNEWLMALGLPPAGVAPTIGAHQQMPEPTLPEPKQPPR